MNKSHWIQCQREDGTPYWYNAILEQSMTPEEYAEATKKKKKRGAPSIKTQKLLDSICAGIALGKSSRSMCIEVGISQDTLWRWIATDKEFSEQYARAKELGADCVAEEMLEIADDGSNDWMESNKPNDPGYDFNGEHVQRSRLRVDARKWYLSKIAPKKYGDKVINTHEGGDPANPIQQHITVSFVAANAPK